MDKIATWAVGCNTVAVTILVIVGYSSILLVGQSRWSAVCSTWLLALGLAMKVERMSLHLLVKLICLNIEVDELCLMLVITLHIDRGSSRSEPDLIDLVNLNLEVLHRVSPFLFC